MKAKYHLNHQGNQYAENNLLIKTPEIFSFDSNLRYLLRDTKECMYQIDNKVITRVIIIEKTPMLVQISAPNNRNLLIKSLDGKSSKMIEAKNAVIAYVRDWFDLDTNLSPFYKIAKNDPLLKQTIKNSYGLRLMGIPDLFEALCWAVLGQQINLGFAYTLKRQFVEKYGNSINYNGKKYWIFPTYEKISKLDPKDMSDIQMTLRKSEYIIGIAQLMAEGELSKEKLLNLDNFQAIEKELIKIRGIGPWTANYILMRCLRDPSAFPIADVGLMNAIKHLKGMDRKPTKEEILKLSVPWKNWEAYATFYLWHKLY